MLAWTLISIVILSAIITLFCCRTCEEGIWDTIGCTLFVAGIVFMYSTFIFIIIGGITETAGGFDKEFNKVVHEYSIAPAFEPEGGFDFSIGIGELDGKKNYVMYVKTGEDRKLFRQLVIPVDECELILSEEMPPQAKRSATWRVRSWWIFGSFRDPDGFEHKMHKWKITIPNNTLIREFKLEPMKGVKADKIV